MNIPIKLLLTQHRQRVNQSLEPKANFIHINKIHFIMECVAIENKNIPISIQQQTRCELHTMIMVNKIFSP